MRSQLLGQTGWFQASMAFALTVAYVPGIVGAATSPRWAIAALSLPFLKLWPAVFGFVIAWTSGDVHWIILAAAFSWGTTCEDLSPFLTGIAAGIFINAMLVGLQLAGYSPVQEVASPSGLFVNKNTLGELAAVTIVLLATKEALRNVSIVTFVSVIMVLIVTHSKNAWLAIGLGLSLLLPWYWRLLSATALLGLVYWYGNAESLEIRFALWRGAVATASLFGNGAYAPDYLHNDWLQFVWECGVFALPVFWLLWKVTEREPIFGITVVVLASFSFPLHMPATGWLIAVAAGHIVGRGADLRRNSLRASVAPG